MPNQDEIFTWVHTAVEAGANVAFALSGLLAGIRKQLDVVGICVVMGLAAFGGGTLRDVLLDRRPFFWVDHPGWLWVLIGTAVAAIYLLRTTHYEFTERAIQWPDALGLGLFTASGTQLALAAGTPALPAVLMGVISATFGGILRDVVCNEIPTALRDRRPYAVCAFVGGWVYVFAVRFEVPPATGFLLAAGSATGLRAAALLSGWSLPAGRTSAPRD
ncbi:trimeric intracellular cation channel family protein [Ramlibacter sp. USB13]|uniref:Trimeric intracellular cation channel family protein n=2 Tax=Ramlibacter cellulosilyticus TaxID=2764187 RepID=A0A923MNQ2_9BURK|nr:trimeric intracellular cation channel family protein [Ramlibacter cellulosilyticus]MBC5781429.1 trimeric intracellular cation channel family protein [Ramlibacter cellulosilyticus]